MADCLYLLIQLTLSSLLVFLFSSSACQVEYDGLTGRVEFNSKGQRTNYTLRILEKHRGGHKEVRSHLLSCSSQVTWPTGFGVVIGHLSDFTMLGDVFNTKVSLITDSPDSSCISSLCDTGLRRFTKRHRSVTCNLTRGHVVANINISVSWRLLEYIHSLRRSSIDFQMLCSGLKFSLQICVLLPQMSCCCCSTSSARTLFFQPQLDVELIFSNLENVFF